MKGRNFVFLMVLIMAFAAAPISVSANDNSSQEEKEDLIEQVKERLDVEISSQDAKKLVDTMERLEEMGFSVEYVLEKAENLYEEYGVEFVDHVEEEVAGAVKNAASNAISSFFENLTNSVKMFFTGLFS